MAAPRLKPHDPEEYIVLLKWFRGAKSILEIGSRFGYPLVDFAHCMNGFGRVVSIDLPDSEGWNPPLNTLEHLQKNIEQLKDEGYDAHLIVGDSHDPKTLAQAKFLGPYDVVFIDGDHSYAGARKDWEDYGPLGNRVIFHDICRSVYPQDKHVEVWRLWEEIRMWNGVKLHAPIEEYLAEGSRMGIGRIDWNASSPPT